MGQTYRRQLAFKKKKKNQVKSPSPESRVPETGSDPPIGSDRDSGLDTYNQKGDKTIWSHDLGEKHHIWERKSRATT